MDGKRTNARMEEAAVTDMGKGGGTAGGDTRDGMMENRERTTMDADEEGTMEEG